MRFEYVSCDSSDKNNGDEKQNKVHTRFENGKINESHDKPVSFDQMISMRSLADQKEKVKKVVASEATAWEELKTIKSANTWKNCENLIVNECLLEKLKNDRKFSYSSTLSRKRSLASSMLTVDNFCTPYTEHPHDGKKERIILRESKSVSPTHVAYFAERSIDESSFDPPSKTPPLEVSKVENEVVEEVTSQQNSLVPQVMTESYKMSVATSTTTLQKYTKENIANVTASGDSNTTRLVKINKHWKPLGLDLIGGVTTALVGAEQCAFNIQLTLFTLIFQLSFLPLNYF